MKRELAGTKAILDGCVMHPDDLEGQRMLAQQLANNRALTDLLDKIEAAFSEAGESR